MSWALSQAGVDGLELPVEVPAQTRKPAASKAARTDEDEDDPETGDGSESETGSDADDEQETSDTAASEGDAFDPDAPVLGEDAAEDTPGDAEDDDDNDPKTSKIKKDNFKLREKRRELQEALQAKENELAEMRQKLEQTALPVDLAPNYGGYFTGVKTLADVDAVEERIQADLDYLEDNPDGYEYTDNAGQFQTVSAEDVRAYRRTALKNQREAAKVREHLKSYHATAQAADALARKKYPFVYDATAKRNSDVLDLAKEFPSLARDPRRALILGRMAVARLVESGEYTLTKRGTPAAVREQSSPSASPAAPRHGPSRQAAQHTRDPELSRRIAAGDSDAAISAAMALLTQD